MANWGRGGSIWSTFGGAVAEFDRVERESRSGRVYLRVGLVDGSGFKGTLKTVSERIWAGPGLHRS